MSTDATFRFRANTTVGGGHAIRCMTLAEELAGLGWDCMLECNAEAPEVVGALRRCSVPLAPLEQDRPSRLVVIDDYGVDATTEQGQRARTERLFVIDDLADRWHLCEALLDPTPGVSPSMHETNIPAGCRMLLGPRYAPLRSAFRHARQAALARREPDGINRVLVMPGQADQADLASLSIRAVRAALPHAAIDLVLGAGAPHLKRLRGEAGPGPGLTLHVDIDAAAMADLMTRADLAIGAGGGGALERCALGLPTILVIVAENQRYVAAGLVDAGAARLAGRIEEIDAGHLAAILAGLSDDLSALKAMSDGAVSLCDGHGARRFAMACVAPEPLKSGACVVLRKAELEDAEAMHQWQSDPETRRYARNPEVPDWQEHVAWLKGRLDAEDCLFAIVEEDARPAGLIRLDRGAYGTEVSIVIAPESRGRGLGRAALGLARNLVPRDRLTAFVKPENTASMRLFAHAGYAASDDGLLHHDSKVA